MKFSDALKISLVFVLLAGALVNSGGVYAHGEPDKAPVQLLVGLESKPAQVVSAFHRALKTSDQAKAKALLSADVLIFEGGGVERSADEYASHHMLSDMKYLAAVSSEIIEHQVKVFGDIAYSMARTKTQGKYKNKTIDYIGLETIVLTKIDGQWKISHIHWSN